VCTHISPTDPLQGRAVSAQVLQVEVAPRRHTAGSAKWECVGSCTGIWDEWGDATGTSHGVDVGLGLGRGDLRGSKKGGAWECVFASTDGSRWDGAEEGIDCMGGGMGGVRRRHTGGGGKGAGMPVSFGRLPYYTALARSNSRHLSVCECVGVRAPVNACHAPHHAHI